jgi:hypothetical protein
LPVVLWRTSSDRHVEVLMIVSCHTLFVAMCPPSHWSHVWQRCAGCTYRVGALIVRVFSTSHPHHSHGLIEITPSTCTTSLDNYGSWNWVSLGMYPQCW